MISWTRNFKKENACPGTSQKKVTTFDEGNPKAPFSKATKPRCEGGRYSFPWIPPLYP